MDVKIEPDSDIFEPRENYLAVFSATNVNNEQNEGNSRYNSNYTNDITIESNKENIDTNVRGICEDFGNNGKRKDKFSVTVHDTVNSIIESQGKMEHQADKNAKFEPNVMIKTEHQDVDSEDYTHSEHAHTVEIATPEHSRSDGGPTSEYINTGGSDVCIKNEVDVGPVVIQKTDLALAMQEIKQEPIHVQANTIAANTSQETQISEVISDTVRIEENIEHRVKFKPTLEPKTHPSDYVKKRSNKLKNHFKKHNPKIFKEINGKYSCIKCEVTSKWLDSIKRHYKQFHTEGKPRKNFIQMFTQYVCDVCGNVFKNKYNLKCHIQLKHNESHLKSLSQKSVPCLQCSKTFSNSRYLKRHIDRCHLKRKDKECVICCTKFISQERLNKHIKKCQLSHKSHSKDANIRSCQCDIYKKFYKNRQGVADHIRRCHSIAKLCNICGASFTVQSSLNKHMGRAHYVLGRPFPKVLFCMKCPKMFGTKANLNRHMTTNCSDDPFINCDLCHKIFKHRSHASHHKHVTHKDLLPHSCDRCMQTFRRKDILRCHVIKCFQL